MTGQRDAHGGMLNAAVYRKYIITVTIFIVALVVSMVSGWWWEKAGYP